LCLFFIAFTTSTANATTARRATLEELAGTSDLVAIASVGESRSRIKDGRIYTDSVLHLDEVWKSKSPQIMSKQAITLSQLGGVVDGIGQHVAGVPKLRHGERAVFFLAHHEARYFIVGLNQGLFVVEGGTGGTKVRRRLNGTQFVHGTNNWQPTSIDALRRAVAAFGRLSELPIEGFRNQKAAQR